MFTQMFLLSCVAISYVAAYGVSTLLPRSHGRECRLAIAVLAGVRTGVLALVPTGLASGLILVCFPHAWLWWPPKKHETKTDDQMGSVHPKKKDAQGPFRVQVWLHGKVVTGPKRQRRREADADLEAMKALPRTDMAAFLQRPKEERTTTAHGDASANTAPSSSTMTGTARNAQKRKSGVQSGSPATPASANKEKLKYIEPIVSSVKDSCARRENGYAATCHDNSAGHPPHATANAIKESPCCRAAGHVNS